MQKKQGVGLYEEALCYELSQVWLRFERQQSVPIKYKKVLLSTPLRLDLIVENNVIVDNKAKAELSYRQTAAVDLLTLGNSGHLRHSFAVKKGVFDPTRVADVEILGRV